MSSKNILGKILQILKQSTPYHISTIDCINFLLGNKLEETDLHNSNIPLHSGKSYAEDSLSETMLQEIASGNRMPSQIILNYFAASDDWSLSRLGPFYGLGRDLTPSESEKLVVGISALCNEFIPDLHLNNFSDQIKYLVRLHFFNTTDTVIFPKYTQTTIDYYIPWSEKNDKLRNSLKESDIVFVSGFPGMGKKQLVRHYLDYALSHHSYLPYNIAWLDVTSSDSSLKSAFSKSLTFLGNEVTDLNKKCGLLKQKVTPAIVIINCPFLQKEDFDFISQYLEPTKIKYIIITRTPIDNSRVSVQLAKYDVLVLKRIFSKLLPKSKLFSDDDFKTLCSRVSYNPLAISLIAKMLKKSDSNKRRSLKAALLDSKTWIWHEKNLPKTHSFYKSSDKTGVYITTILQRMLSDFPERFMNSNLSELALWTRYSIPMTYLKTIVDFKTIHTATEYGLLQFNDEKRSIISMPTLLAETILNQYPLTFLDYEEKFRKVIYQSMAIKISAENSALVYCAIYNSLFYFQYDTIKLKSRPSQNDQIRIDSWNSFLSDAILYYSSLGHQKFSDDLSKELYITSNHNNEISQKLTPIQTVSKDSVELSLYCTFGGDKDHITKSVDKQLSSFAQLSDWVNLKNPIDFFNIGKQVSNIFMITFDRFIMQIYKDIKSHLAYSIPLDKVCSSYIATLTQVVKCSSQNSLPETTTCYVNMIYHYLSAVFYPEYKMHYIKFGKEYYHVLKGSPVASYDLKFKADLQRFFHILMQSYHPFVYCHLIPSADTYINFSHTYNELYLEWKDKICSSQNIQFLFTVTSFYLKMLDIPTNYVAYNPNTLLKIHDALNRFENLLTKHISSSEEEYESALTALNDCRELLKLMDLSYKTRTPK